MRLQPRNHFLWIWLLCLGLAACSGSLFRNYGAISPDSAATKAFEAYQVNPDYRYYVSGSHLYPNALIGLHKDQRLDPQNLWREVAGMTPGQMKEIVQNMQTKAAQLRVFQNGFVLTDPQGKPIGVWYSILEARSFLKINEDGTVRIDTPPLDTYEKLERSEDGNYN